MNPDNKITSFHDLDKLAGASFREIESKAVIADLDQLFSSDDESVVTPKCLTDSKYTSGHIIEQAVANLVTGGTATHASEFQASRAYESFEHNGLTFESKIFRLRLPLDGSKALMEGGYLDKDIYFVGLVTSDQTAINFDNIQFGLVRNDQGEQAFFRISRDPSVEGTEKYIVSTIDPTEESMVLDEFKKAVGHVS